MWRDKVNFNCPNCGGNKLRYDIPTGKVKCTYCKSTFTIDEFDSLSGKDFSNSDSSSEAQNSFSEIEDGTEHALKRFICKNCGAGIDTLYTYLVSYCQYCGGEMVLAQPSIRQAVNTGSVDGRGTADDVAPVSGHIIADDTAPVDDRWKLPDEIIPFTITKADCIERYQNYIKKYSFLPEEYQDSNYLEKFTGIYIPEWVYRTFYGGSVDFDFKMSQEIDHNHGERLSGNGTAALNGYAEECRDASSRLDDSFTDIVIPDIKTERKPFRLGYLAGYYADVPDVPSSTYQSIVDSHQFQQSASLISHALDKKVSAESGKDVIESAHLQMNENSLPVREKSALSALVPVWFLTWKKDDRVAYSIIGGTTGECYADMPVSPKQFLKESSILAVVIAFILILVTHYVLLTPDVLMFTALFLAMFSSIAFYRQVRNIALKENHVYDPGYTGSIRMKQKKRDKLQKRKKSESRFGCCSWYLLMILISVFTIWLLFAQIAYHEVDRESMMVGTLLFGIPTVIYAVNSVHWSLYTSKPFFCLGGILLAVLPVIGFFLLGSSIQDDFPFYLTAIAVLVFLLVQIIMLVRYYKLLSTRPIPGYHTGREGGADENE